MCRFTNAGLYIIKGFYEVYTELGGGFLESVYENAMTLVLQQQGSFLKAATMLGLLINFGNEPTFKRGSFTINSKSSLFNLFQSVAE